MSEFDPAAWLQGTQSLPIALLHADRDGKIQAVNPAWSALTGKQAPETRAMSWLSLVHDADREAARKAWVQAQETGDRVEAEFRILDPSGMLRCVQAIMTPDQPPERGYSGVWIDQTAATQREDALRARMHMLEALITNSTDIIFVKDRQGRYLLANPAAQAALLPAEDSLVGNRDADRFSPDTARALRETDLEVMRTGKPVIAEETLDLPDGTTVIHASSKFPYLGADGSILGVMGISRDITAEKALRADIERQEARLEEAQRLAHLGSWEWDIARNRLTWSEEHYRIYGLDPETFQPTYETALARVHPEDRERVRAAWQQALSDRQTVSYAYRILRPDGSIRHLSGKGHLETNASGKPLRAFGTALDITDLREVELQLRRSHAILEAEQEADLDGILIVDEHRRVLTYNHRFQELWDFPSSLMESRDDRAILSAALPKIQDAASFRSRVEAFYSSRDQTGRHEIHLKDGRALDSYTAPIRSEQGEFFGRVWFFRDVTPQKRLEEGLREQNRKLQELDALKSNFVNAISHDLRTPLASIMGYAEFLEDEVGGPLGDEQHDFVTQIQRNAHRLEHLVDDLLDFARMDAGTFKLVCKHGDLGALARGVIASLRPLADEARVAIVDALPEEPLQATFDSARIERVLMNLIGNALKFTSADGAITVSGRLEGEDVLCEIRDTGIGIALEDVDKLFQRFSQLSHGMRQANGTGLGLSISKALVEAHGGAIGVKSIPGKGSTFWFRLPRCPGVTVPAGG